MFTEDNIFRALGLIVVAAPLLMAVIMGLMTLASSPLSERASNLVCQICTVIGFTST
jgi:hypothetical protein